MKYLCLAVLAFTFFSSLLFAEEKTTHNWNQWNTPKETGPAFGTSNYAIDGEFEYFVTDIFGLAGETAIPVSSEVANGKVYPFLLGGNVHILPRNSFDIFVGGKGGFTNIKPVTFETEWAPTIEMHAGLAYYFWGMFYGQVDAGYAFVKYANTSAYINYEGFRLAFKTGFFF